MSDVPILFAPNVHTGGGVVLLKGLLSCWNPDRPLRAFLDARARSDLALPASALVHWVAPRIASRISTQLRLRAMTSAETTVISFNGIPPLLSGRGKIIVFQQNRLHLVTPDYRQYGPKVTLRLGLERFLGHQLRRRVHRYIVQTPSMAHALERWYGDGSAPRIAVVPFLDSPPPRKVDDHAPRIPTWDFLFVADGLPHKNHRKLFEAFRLLARGGHRPSLALTLPPRAHDLLDLIVHLRDAEGLRIENLGQLSREDLLVAYNKAGALIYPSLVESFGLPLIEATQANLPIIAAELDYVRDVCEPVETFDPNSEVSIARAIRRHMGESERFAKLDGPEAFWRAALSRDP